MSSDTTSPHSNALSEEQTQAPTTPLPHDRLETARKRISATCAEYGYFNPTYQPANPCSSLDPHLDDQNNILSPPDPEQMKLDLQTLFERILAVQSLEADAAYVRIAIEARDLANNEYAGFDREMFQAVVGRGLRALQRQGILVNVEDLVTLPMVKGYL